MRSLNRLFLVLPLLLVAASCQPTEKSLSSQRISKGVVTHVVVMWLKDRADETARREVLAVGREFEKIPGVISVVGGHMLPSERKVVDSSYDVAFVITFANVSDMDHYLTNPIHIEKKKDTLDRYVDKYVVYDFVTE